VVDRKRAERIASNRVALTAGRPHIDFVVMMLSCAAMTSEQVMPLLLTCIRQ
jgi:hypothetical protein